MLEKIKSILAIIVSGIVGVLGILFFINKNKMDELVEKTDEVEKKLVEKEVVAKTKSEELKDEIDELEEEGVEDLSDDDIEDYWNSELNSDDD